MPILFTLNFVFLGFFVHSSVGVFYTSRRLN